MGTKTLVANAVCVAEWESNRLMEINPEDPSKAVLGGITELIKEAGGATVTDETVTAFESSEGDEHWACFRNQFRKESGLEVPPVMRVKVTVEVETLSPDESKALWDAHKTRLELHCRALAYARALQDAHEFYEGLKADLAAGKMATPEGLRYLEGLRKKIRRLQPHTLRWVMTTKESAVIQVETRDRIDWCDDHSTDTAVVGAIAEIPWRDPAANTVKVRECTYNNDGIGPRDRESDHRMAVELLGAHNDWCVVGIARNGEVWNP